MPSERKKAKQIGADRLAGGIGDADLRQAEHVLERAVDQRLADRVVQPGRGTAPGRFSRIASPWRRATSI
jgi:hypothetical protein